MFVMIYLPDPFALWANLFNHELRYLADVSKMPSNKSELTASADGGSGAAVTGAKRRRKANSQSASLESCGGSAIGVNEQPRITEQVKNKTKRGAKTGKL